MGPGLDGRPPPHPWAHWEEAHRAHLGQHTGRAMVTSWGLSTLAKSSDPSTADPAQAADSWCHLNIIRRAVNKADRPAGPHPTLEVGRAPQGSPPPQPPGLRAESLGS